MELFKASEIIISQGRQLSKKLSRQMHLNARCCCTMLSLILLICLISVTFIQSHHANDDDNGNASRVHKLPSGSCHKSLKVVARPQTSGFDYDDLVWSDATVELFRDQLGIVIESDTADDDNVESSSSKCHHHHHRGSREFLMSSLPGPDVENNFNEVLWQYFSLDAVEHMTIMCGSGEKFTLRAVVTEKMKARLQQLFDGLPLETISNFPSTCYNLKYTQIIGNVSPMDLTEIAADTPFLLDPKAKRWKEIAERWSPKSRPFWRLKADVVNEVQQELSLAKTILQIEASRDHHVNFIGIFIASDDKLPPDFYQRAMNFHRKNGGSHIFMIICDAQILSFCREMFEAKREKRRKAVVDTRVMRKSSAAFDFTLMASCNGTIVSNDIGVLHALMNGGMTVVFKPEPKDDPQFYVPWLISEKMHNWHVIGNTTQ